MTRNTAREIAVHLAYELSFTDLAPEELVAYLAHKSRNREP